MKRQRRSDSIMCVVSVRISYQLPLRLSHVRSSTHTNILRAWRPVLQLFPPELMSCCTSAATMRPSGPVPLASATFTPASLASFRAYGLATTRPSACTRITSVWRSTLVVSSCRQHDPHDRHQVHGLRCVYSRLSCTHGRRACETLHRALPADAVTGGLCNHLTAATTRLSARLLAATPRTAVSAALAPAPSRRRRRVPDRRRRRRPRRRPRRPP